MKNLYPLLIILLIPFLSTAQEKTETKKTVVADSFYQAVKYRNIGPFRGGRSNGSSGVIGDPMTYYMGTTGGGLWKTTDAGQHWQNVSDGFFKTGSVGAVAVSESSPNVVYVGMGEHAPRGVMTSHGDGVYKSTDAGKTWKHMGLAETQHISRVVIHPTNPDIVYIAAQGALHAPNPDRGIFKSIDGGASWEKVLFVDEKTGCSELSMDMNNPQVLYAAMWEHQRVPWKVISGGPGSGLHKSSDGGKTWKKIHKGLPAEKGKMAIAVSRSNSDKVYALIESDTQKDKSGLFVSNNAGDSWSKVSGDNRLTQRAWYYIEVFVDPNNENLVYVLSAPALKSIDGGKSWSRITGTHGDYHDLWINPKNSNNLCISNDGGAGISFNQGKSWSTQANMPTGQFYRINVDNSYPYKIYGGQQDYPSVMIANRELGSSAITNRSWSNSAGGESAFLAFDPDDPQFVMGGSYLGTIEVLDTKAKAGTNIMPAPIQYLGMEARQMKYLYNWNAPIIKSQHEPNTFYHGAQYLLRTKDMGQTWEEASPDLTRNQDDKQGNGGGPYTNEAVGAENYGTLAYVIESPHEKGVIYTGSDDGLVHVTRDNGDNWNNVTPTGLKECLVNAIEVSPHDAGTVYIATTRYKFNDKTPAIYKSTNYGKTWKNISEGIPQGAFTRVIREDNKRKDLLFAGTETGLYASWNGGADWQSLQLNMPITPILDLKIKHDDMVVATSGRAFWVLDDIGLLRQHEQDVTEVKMFTPEDLIINNSRSQLDGNSSNGTHPLYGVNPASGVVMYYNLPEVADSIDVSLEIKDASGRLINTYSSKKDKNYRRWDGGPPPTATIGKKKGLNRFVWNTRHKMMSGVADTYIEASFRGHKAIPGKYTATLKVGDKESSGSFEILANPNYPKDLDYAEYDKFMSEVENNLTEMHDMTNSLNNKRMQIEKVLSNLEDNTEHKSLKDTGKELVKEIKAWDEAMIQRKSKAYDDVENFPNKFTANYMFMMNHTESAIPRVNQPTKDRRAELEKEWVTLKATGNELLNDKLKMYNKQLWEAGVGAIWAK